MSTRSRIGIKNIDGSVDSIYCHHDGYLSYNGELLIDVYNNEEIIRKLLSLGDISGLEKTLEKTKLESYRYRGEDYVDAVHSATISDFKNLYEEYNYLFENGKWYVTNSNNKLNHIEVTKELIEKDC